VLEPRKPGKNVLVPDFGKALGRPEKEIDPERGVDGDRLLLQPEKPKRKIADIKL
jgi:hypothetical protein